MNSNRHSTRTRRDVLRDLSVGAGAGLLGLGARPAIAEPPPETTTIKLALDPAYPVLCWAPKYVALALLQMEGFTDVQFAPYGDPPTDAHLLANGAADIAADFITGFIPAIDQGLPVVILAGMHAGCAELIGNDRTPTIRDLAGKRVVILVEDGPWHIFLSSVAAHIGLDPRRDINWVKEFEVSQWPDMLEAGEIDVLSSSPPDSYKLRDAGVGHVILNTTFDTPWRHYFCCTIAGRREFVLEHPVAVKRAMRALLKANQICSLQPERVARLLVEQGVTDHLEYALRTLREVPYGTWRTHDPQDTMRFFSLRLREAGIIKGTPGDIIARGSDFRFLDQLRRELKA